MKNSLQSTSFFWALFLIFINSYSQNDLCGDAISLTPIIGTDYYTNSTVGTTVGTSIETPLPTCCPSASKDVWYTFVATSTLMTVSVYSGYFNFGFQVIENSCSGVSMICKNDTPTNSLKQFSSNNFIVGNTYFVRVFNTSSIVENVGEFNIVILQPPSPDNDLCENAGREDPCGGTCAPFYGTFHGALINTPTPSCAPNASQDVWVYFIATTAINSISVNPNQGVDVGFEIYNGGCNSSLISCINNRPTSVSEKYQQTNFIIGQIYMIRVFNVASTLSTAGFTLTVWTNQFPPNDFEVNAEEILTNAAQCATGDFHQTTISNPSPPCSSSTNKDVWYKFIATSVGMTVYIQPLGPSNIGMQIFNGGSTGTSIGCINNNGVNGYEIFTNSDYIIGQTYYIRVFNISTSGNQYDQFEICLSNNSPPANDNCSNATLLTPNLTCDTLTQGIFNFSTITNPAPSCAQVASQDVWYKFVATTTTMSVFLTYEGGGIELFQGSCTAPSLACYLSTYDPGVYNYDDGITRNNFVIGQIYFVRVFNSSATPVPSTFGICVKGYSTPSNDLCTNATILNFTNNITSVSGELNGATLSSPYPICVTTTIKEDLWYKFIATNKIYEISLALYGQGYEAGFEIFQNSCTGNVVYCGNNEINNVLPLLTIGATYYIRIYNKIGNLSSFSYFNLSITTYPAPSNDLCSNATVINPSPNNTESVAGSFYGSTLDNSTTICTTNAKQDVWYKFTAIAPSMEINLYRDYNANYYGYIQSFEVYNSGCNGNNIGCVTDYSNQYQLSFYKSDYVVGQTYYVRVLSENSLNSQFPFYINVSYTPPPSNDLCQNATVLLTSEACAPEYGTLLNSTINSTAPNCVTNSSQDVWYKFVATQNFTKINLYCYNANDFGYQIFQGSCSGAPIACFVRDPQISFEGPIFNNLIIGETYFVRLFNPTNIPSEIGFSICIEAFPPPLNDLCTNAILLNLGNSCTTTSGTFNGATIDSIASCAPNATKDVWYKFVATNQSMSINLLNVYGIEFGIEVKTGSCTGSILGCSIEYPTYNRPTFYQNNFVVGQTYYVRIIKINSSNTTLPFEIFIQEFLTPNNDLKNNPTTLFSNTLCNFTIGNLTGASVCGIAPNCSVTTQDVWYSFTATATTMRILVSAVTDLDHGFEIIKSGYYGNYFYEYTVSCVNQFETNKSEEIIMSNFVVGDTYQIKVFNAGTNISSLPFEICVQEFPVPTNDLCQNATVLYPSQTCNGSFGTLNSSTSTDSVPTCSYYSSISQDVWYQFTATTQTMTVSLPRVFDLRPGLEIRQGSCNGNIMGCISGSDLNWLEKLTLDNYIVGQTYFVRVFNDNNSDLTTPFEICVTDLLPPSNDNCYSAIGLTPSANCINTAGTFSGATIANPLPNCAQNASQDVWYSFVATTSSNQISISSIYSVDIAFEVYQGNCSVTSLTCINANFNNEYYLNSNYIVGQTYFIRVINTYATLSTSEFQICINSFPPPTNDLCTNAQILTPNAVPYGYTGNFNYATNNGAIPSCASYVIGDVWYQFTATNNEMTITLNTLFGSEYDDYNGGFEIYQNDCSGAMLNCVNINPMGSNEIYTNTNFISGQNYLLRVFNANNTVSQMPFRINVTGTNLNVKENTLNKLALYPNPTKDILNLKLPEVQDFEIISYSITNMIGQTVYKDFKNYQEVDVSSFSDGVYQVVIETDKGNLTGRFVKN
jgi:aspartate carbamoyltransferase regulatory subunit